MAQGIFWPMHDIALLMGAVRISIWLPKGGGVVRQVFRLFRGALCVVGFGGWNLASASDVGGSVSLASRYIGNERLSKVSGNVFSVHPQSLFFVRGLDITARNYWGRWSGLSSEKTDLNAVALAAFAVVPWSESCSNMIVVGASGFERGWHRVRPEGIVHATYKASPVLKYTGFFTWEAGTYETIPFFVDFGVVFMPHSQISLKAVFPAVLEARWMSEDRKTSLTAFFISGRELAYSFDNDNRLPSTNSILDVGRRGWKLGLGASQRAFGGEVSLEGGAKVFQKMVVKSRGKIVEEGKLKDAPFVEFALKFPAFSFY